MPFRSQFSPRHFLPFSCNHVLIHSQIFLLCLGRNRSGDQTPSSDRRVRLGFDTNFLCGSEMTLKFWMREKRGAMGTEQTWRWAPTKTHDENARAGWLWMTRTNLYLEPRREKCILCTTPVAFSELVSCVWLAKTQLISKIIILDGGQRSRILSWMFSWSILLIILPTVLLPSFPFRRPFVWAPPGCWRRLRRGRWGWEFAFFCDVLLPIFA